MTPRPATLQRLDIIRDATAQGQSDSQIANTLGITRWAVEKTRARYGIPSGWRPPQRTHGTYSSYTNGCRCPPCTKANTTWTATQRRNRYQLTRVGLAPDHVHGTGGYTNWGCRCTVCRTAHNAAQANWRVSAQPPSPRNEPDRIETAAEGK